MTPPTDKTEFPALLIVRVDAFVEFTVTLPNVMLPSNAMMREGTAVPEPEMVAEFVPLVISDATVTVPLYACTAVGLNVTVTFCEPPAAIAPDDQLPVNPSG